MATLSLNTRMKKVTRCGVKALDYLAARLGERSTQIALSALLVAAGAPVVHVDHAIVLITALAGLVTIALHPERKS